MKNIIKIITIFLLTLLISWAIIVNAEIPWLWSVQWITDITSHSININSATSWDLTDSINDAWLSILTTIKYLVSWLLVIFLVYAWIQMIMSMWSDEEKLSTAKRQLRYTIMWLVFINIPWTLYNSFVWNEASLNWSIWTTWASKEISNLFIDTNSFTIALWWIVTFLEAAIFTIAVLVIILSWIKIITSGWKEEQITEAKSKILWSIVWLIFIWFIEAWQNFVYSWNILVEWTSIFKTLIELMLFFAWPVAIFFLTLAWYYYITSNGDEERVKKAKNIIINTVVATIILLASYSFLIELKDFNL